MKFTWKTELPALALVALMFAIALWAWPRVPERLPVHFGLDGSPDRWGSRAEGLLVLPVVALALYLLFRVLPGFDPGRANYARFAGAYLTLRLVVIGFMSVLQAAMIQAALGGRPDLNLSVLPMLGVLLLVIGNLMGKLRPNWFVGIRTPWTLSSKRSWDLTHRAGGWVYIACGLLFLLAGLARRPWTMLAAIGVLAAATLALAIYSWRLWATDPDRVPPAGTGPAEEGDAPRP